MRTWRSLVAGVLVTGSIVVMVVIAVLADGRVGSESNTNDGGAWLLNRSEDSIGHVNRVVGEVDTTTSPFTGQFDVEQADSVVVVHNAGELQVVLIDTNLARSGVKVAISESTEMFAAPGAVVLADYETGQVWRFRKESFGEVQSLGDEPAMIQTSPGMAVSVGREGSVLVADSASATVFLVRPDGEVEIIVAEDWAGATVVGATFVGETPVIGLDDRRFVVVSNGSLTTLSINSDITVWQQPSESGHVVIGITSNNEIVAIDVDTGVEETRGQLSGSSLTRPIFHNGCVWVVTSEPTVELNYCGKSKSLSSLGSEIKLTLVNGWVWVNDVEYGNVWFVRGENFEVEEINDWTAALNLSDSEDQLDEAGGDDEDLVENANAEDLAEDVDKLDEDERNTPPVAEADQVTTPRARTIVVKVLENDFDEDNDPLVVEELIDVDADGFVASGAKVTVTPDGSAIQVAPFEDFVGEISFSYRVHDGRQGRDTATVRVTVISSAEATNRPPETVDDNATVRAGRSVALNVLTNDSDPDGDVLVLLSVGNDDDFVNFTPDGEVLYSPDVTSAEGTIELRYRIADDFSAEAFGTIRIRVRKADSNQKPEARNDVGRTTVGQPVILNVLANDMDPDGDPLSVQNLQPLDSAVTTAQLTPDGQFLFRPETAGTHRFTYTVTDGPEADQAQIRIDVEPQAENRPPIAVLDSVVLAVGETRLVRVLENDGDPDGDIVGIVDWFGTVGLEITEVPGVGFNVTATPTAEPRSTFRYWISDGKSTPVLGHVIVAAIQREPVDYPPIAIADTADVRAGQTSTLQVLRNDYDPEGKYLAIVGPLPDLSEGLLRIAPDAQTLLLTVDDEQQFSFQFTYDVEDPAGNRASAVVNVRIVNPNQPNRAPVAVPDIARTPAETGVVIPVIANDFDPDGDPITVEAIAEQPEHGVVEILDDDTILYTPNAGFAGTDSFVYTLVDGYQAPPDDGLSEELRGSGRDLGEVYIGVMSGDAVNRDPIAVDDVSFPAIKIGSDPVVLSVLVNDSDPDNDAIVITEITGLVIGSAEISNNGQWIEYTPPLDGEPRELSFSYSIADGRGGVASAQVLLELFDDPEPIPAVAVDDTVGPVKARGEISFDPRDNDFDPDGLRSDLVIVSENDLMAIQADGSVTIIAPDTTSDLAYRVRDSQGLLSDVAFVTVLVTENEAPSVLPIAVETKYNEPIEIDLHSAVSDPDDDSLVITLGQNRSGGSVSIVGNPADNYLRVLFTPNTDFEGVASFDFTVDDLFGHIVAGGVSVTVLPPENRTPVAAALTIEAEAGVPSLVRLSESVTDPDPDGASNHSFSIDGPTEGNVTLEGPNSTGEVWVRSAVDGGGVTDSFTYTVIDGEFTVSNTVSINLAVPSFDPPSLNEDGDRVLQGETTGLIDLLANDVDNSPAELVGDGLIVVSVGVSPDGTVEQQGNSVVFIPNPEFFGNASFNYTVQDGRRSIEGESVGLVTVEVIGRPDQPQPPSIDTIGNEYLIVSWLAPQGAAARAPVEGYVLEYEDENGVTGSVEFEIATTNYRWESLSNDVSYCFRVAATNEAGQGPFSELGECQSPDVRPEAPTTPSVEFGDGNLIITWSEPLNQGSAITNYQVRISGGKQDLSAELGLTTTHTWIGLDNGTDYTFEVRAKNSAGASAGGNDGWSDWSALSAAEHPLTLPDAPAKPIAVRGDRQVEISWVAPVDGGDQITLYQIRSSYNTAWVDVVPQGVNNTHTWQNIPNGTDVSFEVRAVNRDPGSTTPGNISSASDVVTTCFVPDAPALGTAIRGDQQVTVVWSAPDDQGCTITEYRIESSGGGIQTASGAALNHIFTGLTNGTSYTFTVTAINEVVTVDGLAPIASVPSNAITPAGPPFATNVTSATNIGVKQVRVTWSAAADNGSAIIGYDISVNGGAWAPVGIVTSVDRLEGSDGGTYTYRVRAVNNVGSGSETGATATVVTWSKPGTPGVSASGASTSSINSSWNTPSSGGTSLTGAQYKIQGTGACSGGSSFGVGTTSRTWGGLSASTTYRVCVRYLNAVGWGNYGSATATTYAPPAPVIQTSKGPRTYKDYGGATRCHDLWICNQVNVSGQNFAPNSTLQVLCGGDGNWYNFGATTNSGGDFSTTTATCWHTAGSGGNQLITIKDASGNQASQTSSW